MSPSPSPLGPVGGLQAEPSPARSLKEQKNLNSFFAVMFGVSNTAVSRLAKTWEVTGPPRDRAGFPGLEKGLGRPGCWDPS